MKLARIMLALLLTTVMSIVAVQAQATNGITVDRLNVRTGPGTTNPEITQINARTRVLIEARNDVGNWIIISTPDGNIRGWVASRFVDFDEGVNLGLLPVQSGQVNAPASSGGGNGGGNNIANIPGGGNNGSGTTISTLNVRSGPGTNNGVITQIPSLQRVIIESRNQQGNWVVIRSTDGAIRGWVAARFINFADGVSVTNIPVVGTNANVVNNDPAPQEQSPGGSTVGVVPEGSGGNVNGTIRTNLNVRGGPGTNANILTQINGGVNVIIEGRNQGGDWLVIRTSDNAIRGWVAARYVAVGGVDIGALPVTDLSVTQAPTVDLPEGGVTGGDAHGRLMNTPLLHNMNTGTVRAIYQRGRRFGNNANVFIKVGDSVTATQPFMTGFGTGQYALGGYGNLQNAINWFSESPRDGVANSFVASSQAAQSGFIAAAVRDGLWTNVNLCGEVTPLRCEYELNKPAVAVVMFGPQDVRVYDAGTFYYHMNGIITELKDWGVIPILTTFHTSPNYFAGEGIVFNGIILDLANQHGVPMINLYRATQTMPDYGIQLNDPVHLTQGPANTWYAFGGAENQYGVTTRNLMTLQALEAIRQNVLR